MVAKTEKSMDERITALVGTKKFILVFVKDGVTQFVSHELAYYEEMGLLKAASMMVEYNLCRQISYDMKQLADLTNKVEEATSAIANVHETLREATTPAPGTAGM